jgi:hypothetical protein
MLPAHPLEQHLGRAGFREPAGELLAIVGQHFRRDAVGLHGRGERVGDRPAGRDGRHRRDDHITGMVIDPAQQPALAVTGQVDAADQVQLPQRRRRLPLPPPVLAPIEH